MSCQSGEEASVLGAQLDLRGANFYDGEFCGNEEAIQKNEEEGEGDVANHDGGNLRHDCDQ